MRILITGGMGFIGSHLVLRWLKTHPGDEILNLDKLTYAANPAHLESAKSNPRYRFLQEDLANAEGVQKAVESFDPDGVVHLAAESHVDKSISGPAPFIQSNLVGTFNLLESCHRHWQKKSKTGRFAHVSTDEVYGSLNDGDALFDEKTPYQPNSVYSATKAGSDHLVRAYHKTFGMQAMITHCSNNFGPHQHDEKLIPTIIRNALSGKPIPIYGQGLNRRDWPFVKDHATAIELVFQKGRPGEVYDIGADNEWKNLDLAKKICGILNETVARGPAGDYASLITFVKDRPGHDFRYAIDSSKITQELGWKPTPNPDQALRETVAWFVKKYSA